MSFFFLSYLAGVLILLPFVLVRAGQWSVAYAAAAAIALGIGVVAVARLLGVLKPDWRQTGRLRRGLAGLVLAGATWATLAAVADPLGAASSSPSGLSAQGQLPELNGAVEWLNSAPLTAAQLRGKVVLVDFWTYSCINCIRTLPYVRAWYEKYKDQGLVVIGVHSPEFAFEKNIENVKKAVAGFHLDYPIAVDNDFRLWRAFHNSYWPAFYLVDAQGRIRYQQFGEGAYGETEKAIQQLLKESGNPSQQNSPQTSMVTPDAPGIQAAPDLQQLASGETYLGYRQASGFASPERLRPDTARDYTAAALRVNQWSLSGNWQANGDAVLLKRAGGVIAYRFRARDLHLVLGPDEDGKPVRFQVSVDGQPPAALHGADIDAGGNGAVTRTRLYQLVRQQGGVKERNFEVRFLDPGVRAYAFTFG